MAGTDQSPASDSVIQFPRNSWPFPVRWMACAVWLMCTVSAAAALEPATPLANYGRQAWVMESGLPQNTVQALAQTRDGFLWVGTEAGLARFDGVSFTVFDRSSTPALPGNDIRCLLETADGALWIGTSTGLARWQDGTVRTFTTQNGLPGNTIRSLSVDERGLLTVATENGSASMEIPTSQASRVAPVHFDQLVSASPAPDGILSARLADDGSAQATASTVTLSEHGGQLHWSVRSDLPGSRVQALFADREGSLWIGTNDGLARVVEGKLQTLPATDSLAHASVLALTEDREGDLWVGTETDGLHILRDQRFRVVDTREGLSSDHTTAVVEDGAGMLWVGTQDNGLNALRESGGEVALKHVYSVSGGLASDVILSLAAHEGDLWVGTPDGLSRIRAGSVTTFTSADGLPDDFIRSLLVDADGSLWIGTRHGLAHWTGAGTAAGTMRIYTQAEGLGSDLVGAMTRDAEGDLWVATLAGLSRLHAGKITNYTTASGLSSNVVTALLAEHDGTLRIGTEDRGWDIWNGRQFSPAPVRDSSRTAVHAILDDGRGHLWFATGSGIARCDRGEGTACGDWMEFGPADGLRSREMATNSHPSAWRSHDGLLWFTTPRGLVEVDPAHFHVNLLPPPVALERFVVDDIAQPLASRAAGSWIKVPAGHVHFEFDYAGLSFVTPQKVRYRYMLEGFDHGWTQAGTRRAAYYTNIPPGRYTFRVQAANNDGVWNATGAALEFDLRPHFYQTAWFYVLLAAAIIGLVVVLIRRRLRRAERDFEAVLGERNRIAREIHDTLAQGYVGVSVQLELLAELLRMSRTEAAQKQLDVTRGYVREGLADARQSIWALRTQDAGETMLPVRLRRLVEAAGSESLAATFSVYGAYRPLPADTEQELLRVAQEAIQNVKKHAAASKLAVRLEYGTDAIILQAEDNGRGGVIDMQDGAASGHFGLTGMRERAAAIGGRLEVKSAPDQGTTIRLVAPVPEAARELR